MSVKTEEERTADFFLKLEDFPLKSPRSSPVRRSARLCVEKLDSLKRCSSSPEPERKTPSPVKRKRAVASTVEYESPTKAKKKRSYAPPETYAHLNGLPDHLDKYLDVVFCGINPGVHSAELGHHFSHPCNQFYRLLYGSEFTDHLVHTEDDSTLPANFNIGLTTIVSRPSVCENELSADEIINGTPVLLQKVAKYKPRFVCFLGKGMGQRVEKGFRREIAKKQGLTEPYEDSPRKRKRAASPTKGTARLTSSGEDTGIGLRPYKITHADSPDSPVRETLFFISHSPSGLATTLTLEGKIALFKQLRALVRKHRSGTLDVSSLEEVPVLM